MNEFRKKIFNQIARTDPKAIGNIIYALLGCEFCQAFNIDKNCKSDPAYEYCTDYIDDFIKNYYLKKEKELQKKSEEANSSFKFWDNDTDNETWNNDV